jgi:hypothetical protein
LLSSAKSGLGRVESELSSHGIRSALIVSSYLGSTSIRTDHWQLLYVSDLFYIPTIFVAQLAVSLFFLRLSGPERSFLHRLARFIGGASVLFAVVCFLMIAIRIEDGIPVWGVVVVGHKSIVSFWNLPFCSVDCC